MKISHALDLNTPALNWDENELPIGRKQRSLMEETTQSSTFNDRIKRCLDPIMNRDYGCLSDRTRLFSCITEQSSNVLECLYFGQLNTGHVIRNTETTQFPCDGESFTSFEAKKITGCAGSGGNVLSCDIYLDDWCDCPNNMIWNDLENRCGCTQNQNEHESCCTSEDVFCRDQKKEFYDCEEGTCVCRPGYHRLGQDPEQDCVEFCSVSTQNNPLNFTDPELGAAGCGRIEQRPNWGFLGSLEDYCCSANRCVLDLGARDSSKPSEKYNNKTDCIFSNGFWKITKMDVCPREGYCTFTECDPHFTPVDQDELLYISECDEICASHKCENACETFAGTLPNMIVNPDDNFKPTCDNTGHQPLCKCWLSIQE